LLNIKAVLKTSHKARSIEHQTPLRPTGGVFTVIQELLEGSIDGRFSPKINARQNSGRAWKKDVRISWLKFTKTGLL